jgi:hypothetical protein
MKNFYEIFDEFESAKNKKDKLNVLNKYISSPVMRQILFYAYHPNIKWKVKEIPENYKVKDVPPGMSYSHLSSEVRRLYMFQEGNHTAESLTPKKREELLIQLLESIEPREAEVVMGIFNKDLGVKDLNYKFIKEHYPNFLP